MKTRERSTQRSNKSRRKRSTLCSTYKKKKKEKFKPVIESVAARLAKGQIRRVERGGENGEKE